MQRVDAVVEVVSKLLAGMAGVCTLLVVGVVAVDVVTRNTTGGSFGGAYETVGALMVLITFLGLGYAARSGAHVRMTIVADRLRGKVAVIVRALGETIAVATIAWMAWASWDAAMVSRERGEFTQGLVNFTVWPLRTVVALGFTFLLVEQALLVWRVFNGHRADQVPPEVAAGLASNDAAADSEMRSPRR